MGSDRIGTKLNSHRSFDTNFLFQFEPVIRNPDDKEEVEVFSALFGLTVWITQNGKMSVRLSVNAF